jgi:hypothetical protein
MRHASMRNQTMASRNIERGMREKSPHIEQRFFGVHIIARASAHACRIVTLCCQSGTWLEPDCRADGPSFHFETEPIVHESPSAAVVGVTAAREGQLWTGASN